MNRILLLLLISNLLGQDTLFTQIGDMYIGELGEITEDHVYFTKSGASIQQRIPLRAIGQINSEQGIIKLHDDFFINELKVSNFNLAQTDSDSVTVSGPDVPSPDGIVPVAIATLSKLLHQLAQADSERVAASSPVVSQTGEMSLRTNPTVSQLLLHPLGLSAFSKQGIESQDTLYQKGAVFKGQLKTISKDQVALSSTRFLKARNLDLSEIDSLRSLNWLILDKAGKYSQGPTLIALDDTLLLRNGSGDLVEYDLDSILTIYKMRPSRAGKRIGTSLGILGGASAVFIPSMEIIGRSMDEGTSGLMGILLFPLGMYEGGKIGQLVGSQIMEWQMVYLADVPTANDAYKQGRRDGAKAAFIGNPLWFFSGLVMNFMGPVAALDLHPIPGIEVFKGKSPAYIRGYLEAYSKRARTGNTLFASTGCVGNCFGLFIGGFWLLIAIVGSPWAN